MKAWAAGLAAVTLIRIGVAAIVPLAPDEAYYWIWSHALAPGYLDHPPMVALWIRIGTWLLGDTALGVRLVGPLAAAIASWMLVDAGRALFPGRQAGIIAAVLLNATLLLGVGTVVMTPDSPLLFFWTAALWAMAHVAGGGAANWWLVAGLFGGLALDSKYTALFLWVGVGLWVLLLPDSRRSLRQWQPWAALAIGFMLFAPVLQWNAMHGWAGFIRQGGRVEDWRPDRALGFLAELIGGQIGLVTPLVWVLCMGGLISALRRTCRTRDGPRALLLALSLPPSLVFLQHAIGGRVQGNWPAIIYPALTLAAGGASGITRRWWSIAAALGCSVTMVVYVQAVASPVPLPPRLDPTAKRLRGWNALVQHLAQDSMVNRAAFIAADGYAIPSELAWWLPRNITVVGTDRRWQLFALPKARIGGETGLLVTGTRGSDAPDPKVWGTVQTLGTLHRPGADDVLNIYRVTAQWDTPAVTLSGR